MQPAATVDPFQGTLSSWERRNAWARDEQRLNVMLSRRRCGLLIVGDINVPGVMGRVEVVSVVDRPWSRHSKHRKLPHSLSAMPEVVNASRLDVPGRDALR
ncbi:Uncharacterized protein TPAR_05467 [Tolypocladium paradoxum]|uniref:DNA2/NAM7 helicase-like C-terminal domain-containing protein n=1 Tax=Tolypocladium paradoxum TaxID=94208 RepID=A0A2S4KVT7_9HYPO|nr:Uncharacterized protein TPAR_05467 [Tolypocladium paradoxum]